MQSTVGREMLKIRTRAFYQDRLINDEARMSNDEGMTKPSLLQVVERLERLAGRLPSKIRKAVLSELTPLKQLFLQQRPPRFLFAGSAKVPARKIISALFGSSEFVAPA